mmetsp:Transcript_40079/g.103747  ORF Transcript_40079/g.103747 Transcript_40079/m.103747 type:complete len:724 (-) Transcript_40079:2647-4818(-)
MRCRVSQRCRRVRGVGSELFHDAPTSIEIEPKVTCATSLCWLQTMGRQKRKRRDESDRQQMSILPFANITENGQFSLAPLKSMTLLSTDVPERDRYFVNIVFLGKKTDDFCIFSDAMRFGFSMERKKLMELTIRRIAGAACRVLNEHAPAPTPRTKPSTFTFIPAYRSHSGPKTEMIPAGTFFLLLYIPVYVKNALKNAARVTNNTCGFDQLYKLYERGNILSDEKKKSQKQKNAKTTLSDDILHNDGFISAGEHDTLFDHIGGSDLKYIFDNTVIFIKLDSDIALIRKTISNVKPNAQDPAALDIDATSRTLDHLLQERKVWMQLCFHVFYYRLRISDSANLDPSTLRSSLLPMRQYHPGDSPGYETDPVLGTSVRRFLCRMSHHENKPCVSKMCCVEQVQVDMKHLGALERMLSSVCRIKIKQSEEEECVVSEGTGYVAWISSCGDSPRSLQVGTCDHLFAFDGLSSTAKIEIVFSFPSLSRRPFVFTARMNDVLRCKSFCSGSGVDMCLITVDIGDHGEEVEKAIRDNKFFEFWKHVCTTGEEPDFTKESPALLFVVRNVPNKKRPREDEGEDGVGNSKVQACGIETSLFGHELFQIYHKPSPKTQLQNGDSGAPCIYKRHDGNYSFIGHHQWSHRKGPLCGMVRILTSGLWEKWFEPKTVMRTFARKSSRLSLTDGRLMQEWNAGFTKDDLLESPLKSFLIEWNQAFVEELRKAGAMDE